MSKNETGKIETGKIETGKNEKSPRVLRDHELDMVSGGWNVGGRLGWEF